jgi:nickel transport protein
MPVRIAGPAALLCLVLAGSISCHEIWLERDGETLTLLSGHTGTTHGGAEIREYSPDEVLHIQCFDTSGNAVPAAVDSAYPVRITGDAAVTYVVMSSGYWTRTPFGIKRLPKNEAGSPITSWLSYESVKRIDGWGDALQGPVTDDLEITAVRNPLALKEGKKARLLVTLGGKPLADVPVAYDGEPRGVSDSRGRVNIRIKHGGLQLIQASYSEPADSVKTDEIVHSTTLVFETGTAE